MSKASNQVRVKESAAPIEMLGTDVFDPDDGDDGPARVLDMMSTGMSSVAALRHLEVISVREFAYDAPVVMRGIDKDGKEFEYLNAGRSLAMEAFMQEPVTFMINESTDEKASPLVFVGINGDERWFPRGIPIRVQRKFIEKLMQSSERTYSTPQTGAKSDTDNERPVKQKDTMAYPISIIEDSNPDKRLVRKWYARMAKQGTADSRRKA